MTCLLFHQRYLFITFIYDILSRFFEVSSDLICLNLKRLYIPRTDSCINNAFRSDFNLSKKKCFYFQGGIYTRVRTKELFIYRVIAQQTKVL